MLKIFQHDPKHYLLWGMASAVVCLNTAAAQGYSDQSESLRLLEQAVNAPSSNTQSQPHTHIDQVKKPIQKQRTRAIVFDANEENSEAPDNAPAPVNNSQNIQPRYTQHQQQVNPQESSNSAGSGATGNMANTAPSERDIPKQMATRNDVNCAELPLGVKTINVGFAIQFRLNSAAIAPESDYVLGEIARILSQAKDRCVIIEGHTDASGNWNRNIVLSQDRANSVMNYILDRNNALRGRLLPLGRGAADPIQNLDPRDFRNRRVVFKVVAG